MHRRAWAHRRTEEEDEAWPGTAGASAPLAFAHRGGRSGAPENSLVAFAAALAAGVTGLESDVRLDAAGRPVLSHGPARGPVPLLAELFAACGTAYDLSLDVPDRAAARRCSGSPAERASTRVGSGCARRPRCSRAGAALDADVRLVGDARRDQVLPGRGAAVRRLAALGGSALNLRSGWWSAGLVRRAHDAGLLALAWDVRTVQRWRRLRALGCDGVYSDALPLLRRGRRGRLTRGREVRGTACR